MPSLDEDTRHADRNDQARQRAATQLEPAMVELFPKLLKKWLECDEDELPEVRDAIKDVMRSRRLRQERTEKAVSDMIVGTLKWLGGIAAGGLIGWFSAHQGGGK